MRMAFITSNEHKFKEVKEFFKEQNIDIKLIRVNFEFNEPRSDSIEYISMKKVLEFYNHEPEKYDYILTEDSGLFIPSLKNFPGTYTATIHKKIGLEGILKLMSDYSGSKRGAFFKSCFTLLDTKSLQMNTFCGEVYGHIAMEIRGDKGFGHDPIFIPLGHKKTFAEDYELKQEISHRVNAMKKMVNYLTGYLYLFNSFKEQSF